MHFKIAMNIIIKNGEGTFGLVKCLIRGVQISEVPLYYKIKHFGTSQFCPL